MGDTPYKGHRSSYVFRPKYVTVWKSSRRDLELDAWEYVEISEGFPKEYYDFAKNKSRVIVGLVKRVAITKVSGLRLCLLPNFFRQNYWTHWGTIIKDLQSHRETNFEDYRC